MDSSQIFYIFNQTKYYLSKHKEYKQTKLANENNYDHLAECEYLPRGQGSTIAQAKNGH